MKAIVNQDTCIACGVCFSMCPEVYQANSDGKSEAIEDDIPSDVLDSAKEAKDSCPVDAISLEG